MAETGWENAWRIAVEFMNAYYKKLGFEAGKEEQEFQRGITERGMSLQEQQARQTGQYQQNMLGLEERRVAAGEAQVDITRGQEARAEEEWTEEKLRMLTPEQLLERFKLDLDKTKAEIEALGRAGTGDVKLLAEQLGEATTQYNGLAAMLRGINNYRALSEAWSQYNLPMADLPAQDQFEYTLNENPAMLALYFQIVAAHHYLEGLNLKSVPTLQRIYNTALPTLLKRPDKIPSKPLSLSFGDKDKKKFQKGPEIKGETGFQKGLQILGRPGLQSLPGFPSQ